ncbi:MAG: hypothetical protein ACPGYV_08365, partial [Phycisphaeraceae bacterium]
MRLDAIQPRDAGANPRDNTMIANPATEMPRLPEVTKAVPLSQSSATYAAASMDVRLSSTRDILPPARGPTDSSRPFEPPRLQTRDDVLGQRLVFLQPDGPIEGTSARPITRESVLPIHARTDASRAPDANEYGAAKRGRVIAHGLSAATQRRAGRPPSASRSGHTMGENSKARATTDRDIASSEGIADQKEIGVVIDAPTSSIAGSNASGTVETLGEDEAMASLAVPVFEGVAESLPDAAEREPVFAPTGPEMIADSIDANDDAMRLIAWANIGYTS